MKILLNVSNINVGGGTQVALSFIHSLSKFRQHDFHVFASQKVYKQIHFAVLDKKIKVTKVDFGIKEWIIGKTKMMRDLEREVNPDVVFTIFGPSYWTPKSHHLMGFAMPWLINPETKAFGELGLKMLIKKRIQNFIKGYFTRKNADYFVVETEDVKLRLNKYFNVDLSNTWVVDNTFNQNFHNVEIHPTRQVDVFKFITITANYPHKNLKILKKVIPILKDRGVKVSFTLTIPHEDFKKTFGVETEYLKNLGPILSKECPTHYNGADALFLPTLLECFTASYPEAMIMQRPIITSDLPFAKFICGENNALFFDPLDPVDIADKIEFLITNKGKYQDLVENGLKRVKQFLTPDQRSDKYIQILEEIIVIKIQ